MKTSLHKTRDELPEPTCRKVIDLLNQNLADVLDLGLQARQAHWNVKGPHFIAFHESFDKVAEAWLVALAKFGASARAAIDAATKANDADTADLFTGVSRGVVRLLWLVEAHAQSRD